MNNKFKNKKGFTVLEMVVAVAVFTVVMTMSMQTILNINDAQKKIKSFRVVSDNLNFALDTMGREIRTGSNYSSADGTAFSFINAKSENVIYQLFGGQLIRSAFGAEFPLTDPNVAITSIDFVLRGELPGDNLQPIVRINLSASSGIKDKDRSKIELQTSISQLMPDS